MKTWATGCKKDTVTIGWMAQFNRNPYPEKVVWKQSSVTRNRFYWLGVPENEAQKDALVVASRSGQTITIEKAELVDTLLINLDDEMVDLNKKVVLEYNGEVFFNAVSNRTATTIWKSLTERNDPQQVFFAKIEVTLN